MKKYTIVLFSRAQFNHFNIEVEATSANEAMKNWQSTHIKQIAEEAECDQEEAECIFEDMELCSVVAYPTDLEDVATGDLY